MASIKMFIILSLEDYRLFLEAGQIDEYLSMKLVKPDSMAAR